MNKEIQSQKCLHPHESRVTTNIPRMDDGVLECDECHHRRPIFSNEESRRECRIQQSQAHDSETITMFCSGCSKYQLMNVEEGSELIPSWKIGECIQCGQQHDIHNYVSHRHRHRFF
jgi:hypothetical protein